MKKLLISLFAIVLLVQGYTQNKGKALEFNDKIAKLSTNYMSKAREFGTKLKDALSTRNFSQLQEIYDELIEIIDNDMSQIKEMNNIKGSEKMKTAILEYMRFEKELVQKTFSPFTKMTESTTDIEIKKAKESLTEMTKKEKVYLGKVRKIQADYAKKNGFKVANSRYE